VTDFNDQKEQLERKLKLARKELSEAENECDVIGTQIWSSACVKAYREIERLETLLKEGRAEQ
jgi:hypothetical protein